MTNLYLLTCFSRWVAPSAPVPSGTCSFSTRSTKCLRCLDGLSPFNPGLDLFSIVVHNSYHGSKIHLGLLFIVFPDLFRFCWNPEYFPLSRTDFSRIRYQSQASHCLFFSQKDAFYVFMRPRPPSCWNFVCQWTPFLSGIRCMILAIDAYTD